MRTPATPRSNQKRSTSSCSAQTSGCVQFRSGCSGANRCRYHSPSSMPRPRRAAEDRLPVVRRLRRRRRPTRPEPEARAFGRSGRRRERLLEPRMLARDVVRDDVDDRADAERARLGDQLLGLGERAERRIDRAVVDDVVAVVGERRRVPGVEPERVDAELAQVREPRAHTGEIADAVAVRVGEAADVDLVDDGVAPPGLVGALASAASARGTDSSGAGSCRSSRPVPRRAEN